MALLIGEIFRRNAAMFPDRPAASMADEILHYAELDRLANATARAIANLGVSQGDRVLCWLDTCLDVVPIFVGLAKLGAVFAPMNARLGLEEARSVLPLARASLLIADEAHASASSELARELGLPLALLGGGVSAEPESAALDLRAAVGSESVEDLAAPGLVETDPHVIFFTSGSTGRPKGVVLSHRANWLRGFQGVFVDEPEVSVCMFPTFHMAAFTLGLAAWQTGGEIVFVEQPTAEALLGAVERRRANRLYCIPAIWSRILAADLDGYDLSSLRAVDTGTSATPPELLEDLKRRFPAGVLRVYYGSTEAGAGTALSDRDALTKGGSVGRPVPGVELRLHSSGEICVRSDYMMDGYFDDPEATEAAFDRGWYRTGDVGSFDADGMLWITGRLRDIVRTGGESVSPAEVEAVLAGHVSVAEVAVVGLPDPQWGEVVTAVVVTRPGAGVTLEELRAHCDGRLAKFKWPRRLECVDSLPRTAATAQIQRTLIVERISSR